MAASESKLWYLERINLFRDLSDDEMETVDRVASMRSIDKGHYIYFPEEPSSVVFLLKKGRVKLGAYGADGREMIKAILDPGEVFGELSIAGEEKRSDFAQALDDDTRICAIEKSEMLRLMKTNPGLAMNMTRTIGERLQRMERRFEGLLFKDARTRILDFMIGMAKDQSRNEDQVVTLHHDLTHQDIANLTATSRQTVTTVLNELKQDGVIDFDRKTITIFQPKKLV